MDSHEFKNKMERVRDSIEDLKGKVDGVNLRSVGIGSYEELISNEGDNV